MSTPVTTYGAAIPETVSTRPSWFKRVWDRLIAIGEAQGHRRVVNYLAAQSDYRLAELGYSKAQIHEIRVLRTLPIPANI